MKVKNLNASSLKTKKLIQDTFAELLYEKQNIDKITVTELVKRAGINRSTFYTHYDDIYHVAEDIKSEVLQSFFKNKQIRNMGEIEDYIDDIAGFFRKNESFYRRILQSEDFAQYIRELSIYFKKEMVEVLTENLPGRKIKLLELEISYYCDGVLEQFIQFYRNEIDASLEDIIFLAKRRGRDLVRLRMEN